MGTKSKIRCPLCNGKLSCTLTPRGNPPDPPPPEEDLLATAIIAGNSAQLIAGWARTAVITKVTIKDQELCVYHTKAGKWPEFWESKYGAKPIEGSVWVFAMRGGKLHGGTYESLRPGQVCKGLEGESGATIALRIGAHVEEGPLGDWTPQSGETVWFLVSTPARHGDETRTGINECSDLYEVVWP